MHVGLVALSLLPSGLYGTVVIDPARPVCVAGQPCSAPDRHELLTFWREGRRVGSARTDGRGRYRVSLPPGRYSVQIPRRRPLGRGLTPRVATVPRLRFARVNFALDVGIR